MIKDALTASIDELCAGQSESRFTAVSGYNICASLASLILSRLSLWQ